MFVSLDLNFKSLFDGKYLPLIGDVDESTTMCYMLSIQQFGVNVYTTYFSIYTQNTRVFIFDDKTRFPHNLKYPSIIADLSQHLVCTLYKICINKEKYDDGEEVNLFEEVKPAPTVDDIGTDAVVLKSNSIRKHVEIFLQRHLLEDTDAVQESILFEITPNSLDINSEHELLPSAEDDRDRIILRFSCPKTDKKIGKKKTTTSRIIGKSDYWLTHRLFYNSCMYNSFAFQDRSMIERLAVMIRTYQFTNELIPFCKIFHHEIMGNVIYTSDRSWLNSKTLTDHTDIMCDLTGAGDCEDLAHMFMRSFNVLFTTFPFLVKRSEVKRTDYYYSVIERLRCHYVPFVYICTIALPDDDGRLIEQFHSTMLLISRSANSGNTPISFEVTNGEMVSYVDESFYEWHTKSHFLIKPGSIYKVPQSEHSKMHLLTVDRMIETMEYL